MRVEELSAEGQWELVERSGAERTLFLVVMKARLSFTILEM